MFGHSNCPRCLQPIEPERQGQIPVVCGGCGMVVTETEASSRKRFERQSLYWLTGAALGIVILFMHVVSWGGYALEVLPLQAAKLSGTLSGPSAERMAQICLDLKKLDCTEEMYEAQVAADPSALVRLGKFRFNRMKYAQAAETLRQYFERGGQDADAAYVYARSLGESGKVDEAATQYDRLIAAKPQVLQVTVMQAYVKLLVRYGRFEQALKVIDGVRSRDESVSSFMSADYEEIKNQIKKNG